MQTVSTLLDEDWYERYKAISRLNIRSSIYDVTNRCNLRCKGCFFFSSDEHKAAPEETDIARWEAFVETGTGAGGQPGHPHRGRADPLSRPRRGLLPAPSHLLRHQRPDQGAPRAVSRT